jgi:hypothetical protein
MLRFTLFALVVMVVAIVFFGCKMKNAQTHKVDRVDQIEQMFNN